MTLPVPADQPHLSYLPVPGHFLALELEIKLEKIITKTYIRVDMFFPPRKGEIKLKKKRKRKKNFKKTT